MKLIFLLMIVGISQVFADSSKSLLCLSQEAPRIKKFYDHLDGTDKFKHCGVSCSLGMKCGVHQTLILGFLKELVDVLGPGNADVKDMEANLHGLSVVLSGDAINEQECEKICYEAYRY